IGTTIRFTVYADGSISNLKVLSSPNKKSERAALKRLKNGPLWVIPVGIDSIDTQITIPMRR
ncbi:MAG: energy transducer TonB, partial [Bacteroidota bacterium]